jgi:hypothetical protein
MAVGIAVYGAIFTSRLLHGLQHSLASTPTVAKRAPQIATAVTQGKGGQTIGSVPPTARAKLAGAISTAFTSALNDLLVLSGVLAIAGGACALILIRSKDFLARTSGGHTHDMNTAPRQATASRTGKLRPYEGQPSPPLTVTS